MSQLADIIIKSQKTHRGTPSVVFFGGAGVSTESGIPDFRGAEGLYTEKYGTLSPETIISHRFFAREPETFFSFYRSHLVFPDAKPNRAHTALAQLEKHGIVDCVITQNIDGLHQTAGSRNVFELHGTVHRNYCTDCGRRYSLDYVLAADGIPRCADCGGIVRPDVTLYDEMLPEGVFEAAAMHVARADVLIVAGTSLAVYPAASLIHYFNGSSLVVINLTPTPADSMATLAIHSPVGEVLDEAAREILGDVFEETL